MTLHPRAGTLAGRLLALVLASCGAWVTGKPATGATPAVHVTFLPATQVDTSAGTQEVIGAPAAAALPIGRLHAPRLGDSRMVLAGAGLPLPASGPGHLLLSPYQGRDGALLMLAAPEPPPGFVARIGSGDPLVLELAPGEQALYRVTRVQWIPDPAAAQLAPAQAPALMLITRIAPTATGEPESWYIVTARPVDLGQSL